ncbi:MAG TPA: hypothetical protein VFG66_10080 [Gemmatimonadales bacterium]|nr:hypothetical protein [Gemmatimonadales bacterium]
MTRLHLTALVAALAVGAAAPLAAQDTSTAQPTPPDTSGYQGAGGVDTTAQPGRIGAIDTTMGGAADTAGWHRATGDTTAPDSTQPGERTTRKPRHHEQRMHPGSDSAAARSGAGVDTSATSDTSGLTDTTGMQGRHPSDSTQAGSTDSPQDDGSSSSDSSSNGWTNSAGGAAPQPAENGAAGGQAGDSTP